MPSERPIKMAGRGGCWPRRRRSTYRSSLARGIAASLRTLTLPCGIASHPMQGRAIALSGPCSHRSGRHSPPNRFLAALVGIKCSGLVGRSNLVDPERKKRSAVAQRVDRKMISAIAASHGAAVRELCAHGPERVLQQLVAEHQDLKSSTPVRDKRGRSRRPPARIRSDNCWSVRVRCEQRSMIKRAHCRSSLRAFPTIHTLALHEVLPQSLGSSECAGNSCRELRFSNRCSASRQFRCWR